MRLPFKQDLYFKHFLHSQWQPDRENASENALMPKLIVPTSAFAVASHVSDFKQSIHTEHMVASIIWPGTSAASVQLSYMWSCLPTQQPWCLSFTQTTHMKMVIPYTVCGVAHSKSDHQDYSISSTVSRKITFTFHFNWAPNASIVHMYIYIYSEA